MGNLEFLARRGRVRAPAGFEQSVMAGISAEKRRRLAFHRGLRLAWAGGAALFLAGILSLSLLDRRGGSDWAAAAGPEALSSGSPAIPVMETIDYGREIRTADAEPRTIYILERVSEAMLLDAMY